MSSKKYSVGEGRPAMYDFQNSTSVPLAAVVKGVSSVSVFPGAIVNVVESDQDDVLIGFETRDASQWSYQYL